jgi:hypothetical protein
MNMRSLTVILGALTTFALGACTVTTTPGGSGGSTSATGTGGEAAGNGGAGGGGTTATGTTTSATSSTGTSMCDPNYTCAEAITDGDGTKVCDGAAGDAFDAYFDCVCETTGACGAKCGPAFCSGTAPSAECTTCLQDSTEKGCGKQAVECANN